jgi:phage shock protein E
MRYTLGGMHRARVLPTVLAAAALGFSSGLAACGDDTDSATATPAAEPAGGDATTATDQPSYATLAAQAVEQVKAGATLIDVRTQEEWDAGHATAAQLVPLATLQAGKIPTDLAKDAEIYVYCRSGNRAGVATEILRQAGFENVTNIGGLTHWQGAGGAVSGA